MPLNIKDEATHALARQLAERTGETLTGAVRHALEEKLARLDSTRDNHRLADQLARQPGQELVVLFDGLAADSDEDVAHHQASLDCRAAILHPDQEQTGGLFPSQSFARLRRDLDWLGAHAEIAAHRRGSRWTVRGLLPSLYA